LDIFFGQGSCFLKVSPEFLFLRFKICRVTFYEAINIEC